MRQVNLLIKGRDDKIDFQRRPLFRGFGFLSRHT
jgi:hypothetical protein